MEERKEIESLVELYCDVSNMFLNVKPSAFEKLKNKDIDDILLAKQAFLKNKIVSLIDAISNKESNLTANTLPFKIEAEDVIKQLEIK